MNAHPVRYDIFWTAFLDRQSTIFTAWDMGQAFTNQRTRRSRGAVVFIMLSILFVVAFPTLISAMTGYRFNTEPFIADTQNALIPFARFALVAYVIHDGDRVGLGPDYPVPFIPPSLPKGIVFRD